MGKKPFRIKDTSKTYPKVDAKKLAKRLGADSITGPQKVDRRGRKYFQFEVVAKDGHKTRKIYELSNEELGQYKLLCETEGTLFFVCIFMGRHTDDFHNRVYGYQIEKPTQKGMKIRVVFYEKA